MALPSGYTKLDYIESSGTQYINTGFKPNQNTRCVIDIENLSSAQASFFGARASQNAASFTYFSLTATTGRSDYGSSKQSMSFTNTVGRYTVDQNKNVCTANGVTATGTANTFQLTNNLYLMAVNQADAAIQNAKLKLYSAKIYDNGTLVRDFIPCKNASGTIGLWDNVNSVFYANAGKGTFSTGKKHKTQIDGTGYEIKSGRVLIAGTGYDIKKGRTLIGGTGYDISFGTPVGELAVGTSVFMNVNGVRTEFIVVHQGNPDSSLYDASCNGTWVLMKNIYAKVNVGVDYYYHTGKTSAYLNNTFLKLLDSGVQAAIKQVKIPYATWGYASGHYGHIIHKGANGLSTKIFAPSAHEVSNDYSYYLSAGDGATLDYFANDSSDSTSCQHRVAYLNGAECNWKLRTPELAGSGIEVSGSSSTTYVWENGHLGSSNFESTYGMRPQFIFPFEVLNDDDFNIIA